MEKFKEKVRAHSRNAVIGCVVWATICIMGYVLEAGHYLLPIGGDGHWQSMWHGIISGASFGMLILMIIWLIIGIRALKSEKALKKLYIQETDERNIKIWTSARAASTQAFLMLGLAAGIIVGYFSMTVSITIFACVIANALMGGIFKLYYSRKF